MTTAPVARGDAFLFSLTGPVTDGEFPERYAFGVVLSVNGSRGVAYIQLQSGVVGEVTLARVVAGRDAIEPYRVVLTEGVAA